MLGKFKKRKRLRTHGFLARLATVGGRKVLKARRQKGRYEMAVSYDRKVKPTKGKSRLHVVAGGNAKVVRFPGSNERFR